MEELIKNNLGLQVLTDTGWSEFEGLLVKGHRQVVRLQLTNCFVKTTLEHEIYTDQLEKKSVRQLKVKDKIYTKYGTQSVVSIKLLDTEPVYDLLNVKNNRRFFANDILCSNCEFIINDETLIAPTTLIDLQGSEPLFKTGQVRWYKQPERGGIYVIGLDPSIGTGGDPAAIEVWEANTTEQVAEWRHNQSPIPVQIRTLNDIVNHIYDITGDDKSIYYSVENNTVGEAALISISEWGEENIRGYFLSDPSAGGLGRRGRRGFNTTNKSKISACAKLKNLIESGRMKIHSRSLISELKTFVAHGTSYAAKMGETDDLVMATILVVRMLKILVDFHDIVDAQIRDHGDAMIEPMPFISISR